MITYVRHKVGEERRTPRGRFSALTPDHPMVGTPCSECQEPLKVGEIPSLFVVGPDSPEEGRKADDGRWYTALAVPVHESCAYIEAVR